MDFIKTMLAGIIFLIIAVTVIGTLAGTVDDASEGITQDARCTAAGCFFNASVVGNRTVACTQGNATASDNTVCTSSNTNTAYPLEGLFNTGGVVILLFIAAGLIVVVGVAFNMYKKKG